MIRGIGIDAVVVGDMAGLLERVSEGALFRMFTEKELSAAHEKSVPTEYLASKAIAPNLSEKSFDYRRIETRNREDGSPYIYVDESLKAILDRAGIASLFVSITTTGGVAAAFVVAEA